MSNFSCNVCGGDLWEKIYSAPIGKSLTSLSIKSNQPTDVFFCHKCEHVQTAEYFNENEYYDNAYNILTGSDEEDQIYVVNNGSPIYRTEHQVKTLTSKINIFSGMQILDFGCAKSSTMARLKETFVDVDIFLYDVSSNYVPFWEKFLNSANWAAYEIPDAWIQKFDLVTSFFSLEHISNLSDVLQNIKKILKNGGKIYAIVPSFITNSADLVVADHPNHFTEMSVEYLLNANGFSVDNIDYESHRGALVITATLDRRKAENINRRKIYSEVIRIANFWSASAAEIYNFANDNRGLNSAIYGAGFYGAFLAANMEDLSSVKCILDQNPHLQGKSYFGKHVISPEKISDDIEVIYVGLNPAYAKSIIEAMPSLAQRDLKYFYL